MSDERIAQAVDEALNETEPLESVGYTVTATADSGVVRLSGVVRTEVHRYLVGHVAAGVSGVRAVQNDVLSDQTVETSVSRAIANDGELSHAQVYVRSRLGMVTLTGTAQDQAAIERAGDLARSVPAVVDVKNSVAVA